MERPDCFSKKETQTSSSSNRFDFEDGFQWDLNSQSQEWKKSKFKFGNYQSTNLIKECGSNDLYMIGVDNPGAVICGGRLGGDAYTAIDLFRVDTNQSKVKLHKVHRHTLGKLYGAGCAGAGVHVDEKNNLRLYLMRHKGERAKKIWPWYNKRGVLPFYEVSHSVL